MPAVFSLGLHEPGPGFNGAQILRHLVSTFQTCTVLKMIMVSAVSFRSMPRMKPTISLRFDASDSQNLQMLKPRDPRFAF